MEDESRDNMIITTRAQAEEKVKKAELLVLTAEQYDEIMSQLFKIGCHLTLPSKRFLLFAGRKYSPFAINKLIYKYKFPDVDLNNKYRWQQYDWSGDRPCLNPEHVEYVSEGELKEKQKQRYKERSKARRESLKQEEAERYALGYRQCAICGEEFMQTFKLLDYKPSFCSIRCLIANSHGFIYSGNSYTHIPYGRLCSFEPDDGNCWIDSPERMVDTHGLFPDSYMSLHALAIKASLGDYNGDPTEVGCAIHQDCINPLHYTVITHEEKAKTEKKAIRLEIIDKIPYCYELRFKGWYRNHLFAQISDALVNDDNEKAQELLIKLGELAAMKDAEDSDD